MNKECTKCKLVKPTLQFSKNKKTADGLQSQCKGCNSAYYAVNRDQILARHQVYYSNNRDHLKTRSRTYHHENKADLLPKMRKRYYDNHETRLAKQRVNGRAYRQTPRGKATVAKADHKRRQQMADNVRDFTAEQWQELLVEFSNACAYCGATEAKLTQDHVEPVSKMGPHTKSNIVPACSPCNSAKGNKDPMLWATSFGETK